MRLSYKEPAIIALEGNYMFILYSIISIDLIFTTKNLQIMKHTYLTDAGEKYWLIFQIKWSFI